MSTYRFLQDAYIGQAYFQAGTIAATLDSGGPLPTGWVPPPIVDPLDTPAVTAFYNAGIANPAYCSFPFLTSNQFGVNAPPATHWVATPGTRPVSYRLSGLGAGLPAISN